MKLTNSILRLFGILICSTGLFYQCYYIANEYAKYVTRREIVYGKIWYVEETGISACFRLFDVLPLTRSNSLRSTKLNYEQFNINLSRLSVSDIFNYTPSQYEILSNNKTSCIVRSDRFQTIKLSRQQCYDHFHASKFIHRYFMCYRFTPKIKRKLHYWHILQSQDHFGMISRIDFNEELLHSSEGFTFLAELSDADYYLGTHLSEYIKPVSNIYAAFRLTFQSIGEYLLEAPYDTECVVIPKYGSGSNLSISNINDRLIKSINKITTIAPITLNLSASIVTMTDYENRTIDDLIDGYFKDSDKVHRQVCSSKFNIPTITRKSSIGHSLELMWPHSIGINFHAKPSQILIDLIIYICSSFGMWLGVSAYTMFDFVADRTVHQDNKMKAKQTEQMIMNNATQIRYLKRKIKSI